MARCVTVEVEEMASELIPTSDQTRIKDVFMMHEQHSNHVDSAGVVDKHPTLAIFCGSLTQNFLKIQLIYRGETCCHHSF